MKSSKLNFKHKLFFFVCLFALFLMKIDWMNCSTLSADTIPFLFYFIFYQNKKMFFFPKEKLYCWCNQLIPFTKHMMVFKFNKLKVEIFFFFDGISSSLFDCTTQKRSQPNCLNNWQNKKKRKKLNWVVFKGCWSSIHLFMFFFVYFKISFWNESWHLRFVFSFYFKKKKTH